MIGGYFGWEKLDSENGISNDEILFNDSISDEIIAAVEKRLDQIIKETPEEYLIDKNDKNEVVKILERYETDLGSNNSEYDSESWKIIFQKHANLFLTDVMNVGAKILEMSHLAQK